VEGKHGKSTEMHGGDDKIKQTVYPCPICGHKATTTIIDRATFDAEVFKEEPVAFCEECDTWPVDDAGCFYTVEEWNNRAEYANKLLRKVKELKSEIRRLTYGSGTTSYKSTIKRLQTRGPSVPD